MSPRNIVMRMYAAVASAGAAAILLAAAMTFLSWPFSEAAASILPSPRLTEISGRVIKTDAGVPATQVSVVHRPKKLTPTPTRARKASRPDRARATWRKSARAVRASKASGRGWKSARASWYGPGFYGHTMAGGGVLRPNSMVVAHRSLPFGTRVEIRYGGRTVVAVVRDRGPYVGGRQFDLGPGTAKSLGFSGVGTIQYRVLG